LVDDPDTLSYPMPLNAKGAALDMKVEPLYEETANRVNAWWQEVSKDFPTSQAPVVVMAGFVACTPDGAPTTLKRSGSDYSATIFARLLKASQVTMWKNVDGVFTADPGTVPSAMTVKNMSYDEAIELAYFGGQVLHPTAMLPAMTEDMPVYVRNVFNPSFEGTKITREGGSDMLVHSAVDPDEVYDFAGPIKFVTSIPNIAMVTINGGSWGSVSKMTRRAMGAMEDAGVKVVLVTQACATHSISMAVDGAEGKRAAEAIETAFELELSRGNIEGVTQEAGHSIISVIGDNMKGYAGTMGKLTASLARQGISIEALAQGTSERNITMVVEKSKLKVAMKAVHEEFSGDTRSLTSSVEETIFRSWSKGAQRATV